MIKDMRIPNSDHEKPICEYSIVYDVKLLISLLLLRFGNYNASTCFANFATPTVAFSLQESSIESAISSLIFKI